MSNNIIEIPLFLSVPPTVGNINVAEEANQTERAIGAAYQMAIAQGGVAQPIRFATNLATRPREVVFRMQAMRQANPRAPLGFHFSGHGAGTPGLVLTKDDGSGPVLVGADTLLEMVRPYIDSMIFMYLNACISAEQGKVLTAAGVRAVICTTNTIQDPYAIEAAGMFYGLLALGSSVKQAFDQTVSVALLNSPDQKGIMQLQVADGVNPDHLYLNPANKKAASNSTATTVDLKIIQLKLASALPAQFDEVVFGLELANLARFAQLMGGNSPQASRANEVVRLLKEEPEHIQALVDCMKSAGISGL